MRTEPTENENELPDFVDPSLSFEMYGYPGRHFLIGNPHTFPGRMEGYSEIERVGWAVSLNEMKNVSPAARAWISGFLMGSEPEPPAYTGDERADEVEAAWRAAVDHFETDGHLPDVSDDRKRSARERINSAAAEIRGQADFVEFLRVLDALGRESSGAWTPALGEGFFDLWAAALDTSDEPKMYDLGTAAAIEADWPALARSILRTVFYE